MSYEVQIQMSDVSGAGTDADVYIAFHGENGMSTDQELKHPLENDFEQGKLYTFDLPAVESVGKLDYIRMYHQDGLSSSKMHVSTVKVTDRAMQDNTYDFVFDNWIYDDTPVFMTVPGLMTTYTVDVQTGTVDNAGTNADIRLTIYGPNGDSGRQLLDDDDDNNFEQGDKDTFFLSLANLGSLTKIHIESDGSGVASGWYLSSVKITDPTTNTWYLFDCNKWLDDDHSMAYELPVTGTGTN